MTTASATDLPDWIAVGKQVIALTTSTHTGSGFTTVVVEKLTKTQIVTKHVAHNGVEVEHRFRRSDLKLPDTEKYKTKTTTLVAPDDERVSVIRHRAALRVAKKNAEHALASFLADPYEETVEALNTAIAKVSAAHAAVQADVEAGRTV